MIWTTQYYVLTFVVECLFLFDGSNTTLDDLKMMQGKWVATSIVSSGSEILGIDILEYQLEIQGEFATVHVRDAAGMKKLRFKIKIDPHESPKQIDVWSLSETESNYEKTDVDSPKLGIYKFESGKLVRTFAQTGDVRPSNFEAKRSGELRIVMKRIASKQFPGKQ